eukprot:gene9685-15042_t
MLQRNVVVPAVAGVVWSAGGIAVLDGMMQRIYDNCLSVGMPYLTNYLIEATMSAVAWFVVCLYFTYLDITRADTKVQKDYWPTVGEMAACAVPQMIVYTVGCGYTFYQWSTDDAFVLQLPEKAPTFLQFCGEVAACLVIGDLLIYWEHRFMHYVPYLRNHVHNVHHAYSACFSWAGGWVHPVEDLIVVAAQAVPAYFCHPMCRWAFAILWVVLLIDEHSGHDVWWSPYNWLIVGHRSHGGGADPHDIHHYIPTKNYAFVFCFWDRIFGTYQDPNPETVNMFVPPGISQRRTPAEVEALRRAQRTYPIKS